MKKFLFGKWVKKILGWDMNRKWSENSILKNVWENTGVYDNIRDWNEKTLTYIKKY